MSEQIFSLQEARALLPWLREITQEADQKFRALTPSLAHSEASRDRASEIIHHWAETVLKLGALPKQPFTIDFNSGTDYFCWEYPEENLCFRHSYTDGFAGRSRIKDEP